MSARNQIGTVVILWLAGLGAAAQYGKISVTFDMLGARYPDADLALGLVVSLVGVMGIFLGVTAGLLVAQIRFRRALIWGLWTGALISVLQAFMLPLPLLLASRLVEGASHLAIVVAAPTLIARVAPEHRRGFALTLWGTFFGVAFSILVFGGRPLAERWGLEALFLAHAAYMAGFAVILAWLLPKQEPKAPPVDLSVRGLLGRHAQIYRSPRICAPGVAWLFYTFSYVSILTLIPPFIDPDWRDLVIGAMPLISIASSLTLGVSLLGRFPATTVIVLGFISAAFGALCLAFFQGHPALCLLLAAGLGLVQGAGFAAVPELNEDEADRALANGGLAQTGNIGNTLGTPLLLAVISVAGYGAFMLAATGALMLGVLALWAVLRRISPPA
ncbi:MAG: MFS transporter [Pseudomonadota bacterium]